MVALASAPTGEGIGRRICFLTTNDFGFGGSEDLWTGAARWLVSQGHDVSASVRRWDPCPASLRALAAEGGRMLWRDVPPSADDVAAVVHERPDLVVVAQGYQVEGLEWLRRLTAERIPFVISNNCVHELGWPGTDDQGLREFAQLHRQALAFYFVSDGNKRLYEKFFGAELSNVDILRNPFKVSYDARPPWPEGDRLRLATVGRLECYHKGYDLLMEVLASPRWHERPVEIHLFGDGPHRELLGRLAARSGFPRIEFHGVVDDIEGVWSRHHVLVQPSRLEGMPLSVGEAMLCGRPVVATDVGGHREFVEDGVSGFIAEAATAAHLGRALERLWEARARLSEMGAVAAASARRLLPRDPCQEFGRRILEILRRAVPAAAPMPTGDPAASRRSEALGAHWSNLYWAPGDEFSERWKCEKAFPPRTRSRLEFPGVFGRIRFDPDVGPGRFRIRTTTLRDGQGRTLLSAHGKDLRDVWRVGGTARLVAWDDEGLLVESTGVDPWLVLCAPDRPADAAVAITIDLESL